MKSSHFEDKRKFARWLERNGHHVALMILLLFFLVQCAHEVARTSP
jgi:hypothetical protein